MITLTINKEEYKIRNLFEEITIEELDKITSIMTKGENEIHTRVDILELLGIPREVTERLRVKDFLEVTDLLLLDDIKEPKTKFMGYKVNLNPPAKVVIDIEKVLSTESKEKNVLILSLLFTGKIDNEFIKEMNKEKASDYLALLKEVEGLK
jgi:hypothetical protein